MQINSRRNAFDALFYLVWTIVKEQWKILVGVLIFSLILIFIPAPIAKNGGYENTPVGIIGLFYSMPALIITLVCVPMVHNQIYSSSISKRLKASGVSPYIYAIVMISLFALVALVVFYFMALMAWIIFGNTVVMDTIWDVDLDHEVILSVDLWEFKIDWLSLLVFTPIAMFGLSSTGLLIGRLKLSEIFKGLTIFLFIVIAILMSRTIFNPLNSDFAYPSSDMPEGVQSPKSIKLFKIFMLNPWGSMLYTMQNSFDSLVHAKILNADEIVNQYNGIGQTLAWSTISSVLLFATSVLTMKK